MEEPDGYQVVSNIPAPSLPYNQPGTCYTLVEITDSEAGISITGISCIMVLVLSLFSYWYFPEYIKISS